MFFNVARLFGLALFAVPRLLTSGLHSALALLCLLSVPLGSCAAGVHTSWLWHLHQPVYWPDRRGIGTDHYEAAWDTIQQQDAGRPHPSPEVLRNIFGLSDRVAAYQYRPKDTIGSLLGYPNAGAQASFSGALIENVQSLAAAGQLGYAANWQSHNQQARNWQTSGGKPRLDLVNFTYHHALAPLLSDETLEIELRIHKRQMEIFWGTNPGVSRGYFPTETCFTTRMIPTLKKVGIDWSVIANNHLSRACADFPLVLGSGGENCDLPNKADQLNPPQGSSNYKRISIERGCSPVAAMPFAFQSHYARYVNPATGEESRIIIVPSDQALGWRDSYGSWDANLLDDLAARNNPSRPAMALFAHDGDNAWSGGYSYYMEWVPTFAQTAAAKGLQTSTVEQWLSQYPPDPADVVHVEDGGWMYADGDFGSPVFINWHWPPGYVSNNGKYVVDPSTGSSDKADNWRVIVATENRVKTAQQISGITPRVDQVRDPGSFSTTPNSVELAWHYYLGGLDSGFVYYGCNGDMCHRTAITQSNALRNISSILAANPSADATPPTVLIPQRHPWNPGGTNFGVQYGYSIVVATNTDFWVWTYAHDVSGITNVSLKFRSNGTNLPASDQFLTYAGGALTGPWVTASMSRRQAPPVTGVVPQFIADYYTTKVTGLTNTFVDYYVSAADGLGNSYNSPIQHVWVGSGQGGGPGSPVTNDCGGRVCLVPLTPTNNTPVTIHYYPAAGPLAGAASIFIHLGWNGWSTVVSPDPPMTFNAASNRWEYTTTIPAGTTQLDCVFNNGSAWDNNSGQDWHFAVAPWSVTSPPPAPAGLSVTPGSTNASLTWNAASGASGYIVYRNSVAVGITSASSFSDTGLAPITQYCYTLRATNSYGNSALSSVVCATTLAATNITYLDYVMDGAADSPGYLISSNGMALFAALRGSKLYVATGSPGTSGPHDHFLFVTDTLLASAAAPAPWAKAGTIAVTTTKPYLASESMNSYVAWYNAPGGSVHAKASAASGHLEGVIDLTAAFGNVPAVIYLCAAAYQTADGGALISLATPGSAPAIDPGEFLAIPTQALKDQNSDGTLDRLDPAMDFRILGTGTASGQFWLNWAAMPGRTYQVLSGASPQQVFDAIASRSAGALQTDLSWTNTGPVPAQKFFRIKLLP